MATLVIAHIGKIPVEEYAGFVVPVIVLYAYGKSWSRRQRKKVARLPGPAEALDDKTVEFVLSRWAAAKHGEVAREQLPLMYPPGPDGITASELAERIGADPPSVTRRLEDLADLGYVEYDSDTSEQRLWLTVEGINLLNITEEALLVVLADAAARSEEPATTG
jgi:DNA-binding transcriptional ArsR family regulator